MHTHTQTKRHSGGGDDDGGEDVDEGNDVSLHLLQLPNDLVRSICCWVLECSDHDAAAMAAVAGV